MSCHGAQRSAVLRDQQVINSFLKLMSAVDSIGAWMGDECAQESGNDLGPG